MAKKRKRTRRRRLMEQRVIPIPQRIPLHDTPMVVTDAEAPPPNKFLRPPEGAPKMTLYPGMGRLNENCVPNVKNTSFTVTASVVLPDEFAV